MSNRIYNILFHTHTISGIIISGLLYVIFFAGSISFLRDEINAWERNEPIPEDYFNTANFDQTLERIDSNGYLYGRDISFSHRYFERRVAVSWSASKDTTNQSQSKRNRRNFAYYDLETGINKSYQENYSLGELFYRLHFFAQLNFFKRSGYLLAGFVAYFFLFAIITGVLVHWKKIISNFFIFRPFAKWKTIWTDAHVALGIIGLPYQFIFAVTGAYLIIGYTVMLPPVQKVLFNDNQEELTKSLQYDSIPTFEFSGQKLTHSIPITPYIERTKRRWRNINFSQIEILNYGDQNMHFKLTGHLPMNEKLVGSGYIIYHASTGSIVSEKSPYEKTSYIEGGTNLIQRLHFGDFGNYGFKIIYFILGILSCFVILSGVMIWLVARDKKNLNPRKKKFNQWLVNIYLSACLTMYPATGMAFLLTKLWGHDLVENRKQFIYDTFFWPWLALSIICLLRKNNYWTTKANFLLGSFVGLLIPLANGWMTGNWIWVSYQKGYHQILVIDLFWLFLSLTTFLIALRMNTSNHHTKGEAEKPLVR